MVSKNLKFFVQYYSIKETVEKKLPPSDYLNDFN